MKKEQDKIAEKAYYKYLEKGKKNGDDVNDWLEAEKEVIKEKAPAKKSAKTTKTAATAKKPAKTKKAAAGAKKITTTKKTTTTKAKKK
jgi:hypothetical protein